MASANNFVQLSTVSLIDGYQNEFWVGLRTLNLGEEEAVGVVDGIVRENVGEFLKALHSNFSSIFTRFRLSAAFVLQHATFSHPTSSLPKFPHVPQGVGGWTLGYEERMCLANCPCN